MAKKIWKSKAYKGTKVPYPKSQIDITKLLNKNGIYEIQHSQYREKIQLVFLKELIYEGKKNKIGVKIVVPDVEEKVKNQLYRALFYYLKSKFESLTFGFYEEYNEAFVKEFMPHVITDKTGRTVSDIVLPKLGSAYLHTREGEQLYLEEAKEEDLSEAK